MDIVFFSGHESQLVIPLLPLSVQGLVERIKLGFSLFESSHLLPDFLSFGRVVARVAGHLVRQIRTHRKPSLTEPTIRARSAHGGQFR